MTATYQGQAIIDGPRIPLGYEQVTLLSSVQELDVPEGARYAIIVPESYGVRWRDDGQDPTASVGMPLVADSILEYSGDLSRLKFIEVQASAKLNVSYYK